MTMELSEMPTLPDKLHTGDNDLGLLSTYIERGFTTIDKNNRILHESQKDLIQDHIKVNEDMNELQSEVDCNTKSRETKQTIKSNRKRIVRELLYIVSAIGGVGGVLMIVAVVF